MKQPAVVVTGAASGIGREFARLAAADGTAVVLVDRAREPLDAVAVDLGAAAYPVTVDLVDTDAAAAVGRALDAHNLYCDVLINNAGLGLIGRVAEAGLGEQLRLVDLNVVALTELTLQVLPGMVARGRGGVLNVSSVVASMAGPNTAVYNATKSYVSALSAALASEVAGTGVTVTCLYPGKVNSPFWDRLGIDRGHLFSRLPALSARDAAEAGWRAFRAGRRNVTPTPFYSATKPFLSLVPARLALHMSEGLVPRRTPSPPATGRPAIVVTGASSGIGRELARLAVAEGADIVLIARSRPALDTLAAEIAAAGRTPHVVIADLTGSQAGEKIEQALAERGLSCDILINNAGICLAGPAVRIGLARQLQLLALNVRALTELTVRFLPGMVARRRGGVINVGSIGAYMAAPNLAVYHASKSFVASLSRSLAAEMADSGVTVTCLSPGVVRTPLVDGLPIKRGPLFHLVPMSSPKSTARAAWRGFRTGKALVIPQPLDRALAFMFRVLPRAAIPRVPVEE